jgi:hypothetical protein
MRINKVIPTQDDKIYDHSINKRNYIHTFCQKKRRGPRIRRNWRRKINPTHQHASM